MAVERERRVSDLGKRVKALRTRRGLSLRDVAAVAQVSPSLLGQIERGEASPSLLSLVAIGDALGVNPGSLLDDDDTQSADPITRRRDRRVVEAEFCRREYMMHPRDTVEIAEFIIPPGGYSRAQLASHSGRDHAIVLQGTVLVEIGEESYQLGAGDYIAFDGATPHRVVNRTDKVSRVHWIVLHQDRQPALDGPGDHTAGGTT